MDQRIVSLLRRLEEIPGRMEKFWNVPPETGKFLNILTRSLKAGMVLEIGTSNGYSGLWFAEALSHSRGKLYTVESHSERFELAKQHFGEAGVTDYVEQVFGHAPEIFGGPPFKGGRMKFDLIFLDATKMEYESYLDAVLPLLKTGGVLLADNVLSHRDDLNNFMEGVQQKRELTSVTLPLGSGLLMALKLF